MALKCSYKEVPEVSSLRTSIKLGAVVVRMENEAQVKINQNF